ncbi:MAG: NAD(P)/FAD-dependent oxidoreductase [Myxococcota bacterium]
MKADSPLEYVDVAIVGAGAAGLAAGIFAGEAAEKTGASSAILDGARTIGAKILVSGGGRCNVTHDVVTPSDFFGQRNIIKNVLASFSVEKTVEWFASIGVELKREDTGKLFPVTDKARTVLGALINRCRALNVTIAPNHRVKAVKGPNNGHQDFMLRHTHGTLRAKHVILATGGRSLPKSGSDGFAYDLVRHLGHQVTPTTPALVPLVLAPSMFHATLSGLSQQVELTSEHNGKSIDRRTGSLLWTHFGISGPVVMDASRFWAKSQSSHDTTTLTANFFPGQTEEQTQTWLLAEAAAHPRRTHVKVLASRVPERFAEVLCHFITCDPQTAIGQMSRKERLNLGYALSRFHLPVESHRGWNFAEVTAGGVPLNEINFRTMESKRLPRLYLIGELLDCDGRIGGFNFQWAWTTGRLAGQAAATSPTGGQNAR